MLDINLSAKNLSEVTRLCLDLPGHFEDARRSALSSVGYHVQKALKNYGRRASSSLWPRLHPYTGKLKSRAARNGTVSARRYTRGARKGQVMPKLGRRTTNPMARLVNAVRYEVDPDDAFVSVGFLSGIAPWLVEWNESRRSLQITEKARRKMWAVGLPIRPGTKRFEVPARPWIDPAYRTMENDIVPWFEEKFWAAVERRLR